MGAQDILSDVLILSTNEFSWLLQEVERRVKSLELLLGSLSEEERKRVSRAVTLDCLETLKKGRL